MHHVAMAVLPEEAVVMIGAAAAAGEAEETPFGCFRFRLEEEAAEEEEERRDCRAGRATMTRLV